MKVYVDDLAKVVGGSGNAASWRGNGSGFVQSRETVHNVLALPEKRAGRHLGFSGKTSRKAAHPEEVIPMKDEGFKDF
jgi:hypothetical protein